MTELERPGRMTIASSISHSGRLWNMTNEFSEDEFCFVKGRNDRYAINLSLEPSRDLKVGNYTLTIGARFDNVTYNKILVMYIK